MIRNHPSHTEIEYSPPDRTLNLLPVVMSTQLLLGLLVFLAVFIAADEWLSLVIYLTLLAFMAFALYRYVIRPVDSGFSGAVFGLAFMAKLAFAAANYWTVTSLYGRGDANFYHRFGIQMAEYFQRFDFSVMDFFRYGGQGTTNMIYATGFIYSVLPASQIGGFLFFAALAFMGSALFYRSYCLALPTASPRLYRILVFFLPSILFWTASIGKDAWVYLFSGLVCLGWVTFTCQRKLSGWLLIGVGLVLISLIRPHIAAFHIFAMGVAFFFNRNMGRNGVIVGLLGALLVIVFAIPILNRVDDYMQLDLLSLDSVEEFYEEQQSSASFGGSSFTPPSIYNPVGAVYGVITILFRPFPFEAHNLQALITSLEATGWLILLWIRRRVFWMRIRSFSSNPWLVYAALFSLLMALGLTVTGNFGIVARQRVVFLPLLWLLFA